MLRDITIGQHFPGNSLVHRFDPRLKLVLTVAYIVLLFAASNPLGLTLSILFLEVMLKVEASNSKKPTTAASQRNGTGFMVLPPCTPIIEYPPGGRSSVFCWNVAQKTK